VSPTLGGPEDEVVVAAGLLSPLVASVTASSAALTASVTVSVTTAAASVTMSLAFSTTVLSLAAAFLPLGAEAFLAGRTGAGGGVLRLRSSTMAEMWSRN
jgi:hypothetical protein